jgi:hypothetical protein
MPEPQAEPEKRPEIVMHLPEPEKRPEIAMHLQPEPVAEVVEERTEILMPPFNQEPEPAPHVQETAEAAPPAEASAPVAAGDEDDLLGLHVIFKQMGEPGGAPSELSEADIERIADRVIQKLSAQVIQSMAWDIVPDIVEKVVREELKRSS